jgi:exopolysaccharide biosynthesis polyprenyl glycosylphosphotransferase
LEKHRTGDHRQLQARIGKSPEMSRAVSKLHQFMPVLDFLLACLAFILAYIARYELEIFRPVAEANTAPFNPYIVYMVIFAIWLQFQYRGTGLYRIVRGRSWIEEVYTIINGVASSTLVLFAFSFFTQPYYFSRLMLIYAAGITILLLSVARIFQRGVLAHLRSKGIGVQNVLIVGAGEVGQAVLRTIMARKELGYRPVGYLDDDPDRGSVNLGRVRGLGHLDQLEQVLKQESVELVMITLRWKHHDLIMELLDVCQRTGVEVRIVPDVFQLNLRQVNIENLDGIPLLGVNGSVPLRGSGRLLKRAVDILVILLISPVVLPAFLFIALLIQLEGRGPIFYTQKRIGENGKSFDMIKFRSMIPDADLYRQQLVEQYQLDPRHPKMVHDPRITRVGRLLRHTSLDELPNMINVLRGDMSLVGPRPPTPDEVKLYENWHMQRLQTMPGITGLWQVSGRSDIPFDEMCLLDIYYIENWSIRLDAQILMMTLPRVLLRQGAY